MLKTETWLFFLLRGVNSWAGLSEAGCTGVSVRLLHTKKAYKAVSPEFASKEECKCGWSSNRRESLFYNFAIG